jgi:organic hydroperoxide reductase OsmC/OhrA
MSTIAPFPHRYTVTLAEGVLSAPPRQPIRSGAPPQFGGSDEQWSPEELLVASALLCLETTFHALARHASLPVQAWHGTGAGVLEKTRSGPTFTSITLAVEITVARDDVERAERIFQDAKDCCIIANALRVPVLATLALRLA